MRKLALTIFLTLLFCTPVAYLSSGPLTELIIIIIFYILFFLTYVVRGAGPLYEIPALNAGILLFFYVFLQTVPLPPVFLQWFSPGIAGIYEQTVWIVAPDTWMPVSTNPRATLTLFVKILPMAMLYLVAIQILSDRKRLKACLFVLASLSGLASFFSVLTILGAGTGEANKYNSMSLYNSSALADATWQSLGLIVVFLPIVWASYRIVWMAVKDVLSNDEMRHYLTWQHRSRHLWMKGAMYLSLAAIIFIGSLGSIVIVLLMVLVSASLFAMKKHSRLRPIILIALLPILAGSMYFLNDSHLATIFLWNNDLLKVETTNQIAATDYIWASMVSGTGLGSFDGINNYYAEPHQICSSSVLCVPHLVRYLIETGILGVGLLMCFLYSLLRKTYPLWLASRRSNTSRLYVGATTCLVTIIVAGISGPGISHTSAIYLVVVCSALMVVVLNQQSASHEDRAGLPIMPRKSCNAISAGVTLMTILMVTFHSGEVVGKYIPLDKEADPGKQHDDHPANRDLEESAKRVSLAPLNSEMNTALADKYLSADKTQQAIDYYFKGLRMSPLSGHILSRLSLAYEMKGEREKAKELLDSASKLSFPVDDYHRRLLLKLLQNDDSDKAMEHIRLAITQEPHKTGEYIGMLRLHNQELSNYESFLPEMWSPYLTLGSYYLSAGDKDTAKQIYQRAITYALLSDHAEVEPFIKVINFLQKEGDYNEALKLAIISIDIIPDSPDLHYLAALSYENVGITYRAIEEYQIAILLNSKHTEALKRLRELQN